MSNDIDPEQRALVAEFNRECNQAYAKGKSEFPDFDEAASTVRAAVPPERLRDVLEAVTTLPNAAEVYHHLGKNPDEAHRIARLPKVKMALEIGRLSTEAVKPKAAVPAPAPVVSDEARLRDPSLPWEKFCELREKQERERRARR